MTSAEIILLSPLIELKRDKHGRAYFLIHNQDTGIAYFAFQGRVEKGWFDLITKWTKAKVVLIKSIKEKKVVSLRVLTERELREREYDYLFRYNPKLFKL